MLLMFGAHRVPFLRIYAYTANLYAYCMRHGGMTRRASVAWPEVLLFLKYF
jgi:hypothetical protein